MVTRARFPCCLTFRRRRTESVVPAYTAAAVSVARAQLTTRPTDRNDKTSKRPVDIRAFAGAACRIAAAYLPCGRTGGRRGLARSVAVVAAAVHVRPPSGLVPGLPSNSSSEPPQAGTRNTAPKQAATSLFHMVDESSMESSVVLGGCVVTIRGRLDYLQGWAKPSETPGNVVLCYSLDKDGISGTQEVVRALTIRSNGAQVAPTLGTAVLLALVGCANQPAGHQPSGERPEPEPAHAASASHAVARATSEAEPPASSRIMTAEAGPAEPNGAVGGMAEPATFVIGPRKRPNGSNSIPTLVASPTTVGPSYPPELIRRVLTKHRKEFEQCHAQQVQHIPRQASKLVIEFKITENGRVEDAGVASSTTSCAKLDQCVMSVVAGLTFPHPRGGKLVVRYPFVVAPAER